MSKTSGDYNNVQVAAKKHKRLYNKFKEVCDRQQMTAKAGLKEALMIWLHHEMGDKEYGRYLAVVELNNEIIRLVRKVRKAKNVSEAGQILDQILEEFQAPL